MRIPVKLELFAGIRRPLFSDDIEERSRETHEELRALSGHLQNMISGPAGSVLSIDIMSKVAELPKKLQGWARKHRRRIWLKPWAYISFSATTEFDPNDFTPEEVQGGRRTKLDLTEKERITM